LFRLASALFSVAALFGALKFSGIYADEQPHRFVSMIAGVAGFPAMAISLGLSDESTLQRGRFSILALLGLAMIGALVVMGTGARMYLDAAALLCTLAVGYASWRQRHRVGMGSAALILFGLICFAAKIPSSTILQPADVLHLALAVGWLGLSSGYQSPPR
jgi:hypothetical protein